MVRGGEHAPPHAYNLCVKATRFAKKKLAQDADIHIFLLFGLIFFTVMRRIPTESPVHFAAQPRRITVKAPRMAGHSRKRTGAPYAEAPV